MPILFKSGFVVRGLGEVGSVEPGGESREHHGHDVRRPPAVPVLRADAAGGRPALGAGVGLADAVVGVEVADVVLLHHLPRVAGVAHILERLRRDLAGVLDQDLLASRMLKY